MKHHLFVALILTALAPTASFAWDGCGHETVAALAYARLSPQTKAKVDAIFTADPRGRTFIDAATWPDDIKMGLNNDLDPKVPLDKPWHFVDIPYDATDAEADAEINNHNAVVDPANENSANVVTAIRYFTVQLKNNTLNAVGQADDLSWLIHTVGDIHQPLHCVSVFNPLLNYTPPAKGDEGGNGFAIHHPARELHALWDDMFDEPTGGRHGEGRDSSPENAIAIAKDLAHRIMLNPDDVKNLDPADWARESFSLHEFAYSPDIAPHATVANPAHTITPDYLARGRTEAEKRVALAGARLAQLLETIYGGR